MTILDDIRRQSRPGSEGPLRWVHDDGGRADSGRYDLARNDEAVRALAVIGHKLKLPWAGDTPGYAYDEAHSLMADALAAEATRRRGIKQRGGKGAGRHISPRLGPDAGVPRDVYEVAYRMAGLRKLGPDDMAILSGERGASPTLARLGAVYAAAIGAWGHHAAAIVNGAVHSTADPQWYEWEDGLVRPRKARTVFVPA